MSNLWRKLDNTAKVFSLDDKKDDNTFRLCAVLKEKIDLEILKSAVNKTLEMYPSYKVKIKSGFFWKYLKNNEQKPVIKIQKETSYKNIDYRENNEYLFKVTYFNNKINLDIFHVLTDGVGATNLFKVILYNYLNLKHNLKSDSNKIVKDVGFNQDEYLKNADKTLVHNKYQKKAFLINEKANLLNNKTYHYILDLKKFKNICSNFNVSISEYLTAIYMFAIYKTNYDKTSNKDIIISIPIDLRKYYNVESFSNFFTCMNIEGNVLNDNTSFEKILTKVHEEFQNKLTKENIKEYLARDVKLGTNVGIRLVPLFLKKKFMKYFGKLVNQNSTTTFSNIGAIKVENQYKKYIDNIMALVSIGRFQKVKCTVCSYENYLTVTINSNIINNNLEEEFYRLLKKHAGTVKLINNIMQ